MEEPLRVRLEFEDHRHLLTKSQRSNGLKQSWLLVKKPDVTTISDLASHVTNSFDLHRSCPNGVLLTMDDFVLPPFESTSILKEKDIIRVRKKGVKLTHAIEIGDGAHCVQGTGAVESQPTLPSNEHLAVVEFQEDSGRHRCKVKEVSFTDKENAISTNEIKNSERKRKHSDKPEGSKKKKSKPTSSENPSDSCEDDANVQLEPNLSCSKKKARKKVKPSDGDGKPDTCVTPQQNDSIEKTTMSAQLKERNDQDAEDIQRNSCETHDSNSAKKGTSRSALRKRAKRKYYQEQKRSQMTQENIKSKEEISFVGRKSMEHQRMDQNTKVLEELVPVVVKPGHIRFEPLDEEHSQKPPQQPVETLQWNGTTSKRKGQKWGMEKTSGTWDAANDYNEQSNEKPAAEIWKSGNGYIGREKTFSKWGNVKSSGTWDCANGYNEQPNERSAEKWKSGNGYIGREKTFTKWGNDNGYNNEQSKKWPAADKGKTVNGYAGREKTFSKWNTANGYDQHSNERSTADERKTLNGSLCRDETFIKWDNANDAESDERSAEKGKTVNGYIDFESLYPLIRCPQQDDVLAYRLVELTSSWCPEMSPFRVGKVSSFDPLSKTIILIPLPEYPVFPDQNTEEGESSATQLSASLYDEDGSLKIDYTSLVDVRLFKSSDSAATVNDHGEVNIKDKLPLNNWQCTLANGSSKAVVSPAKGKFDWGVLKEALNEKKAQLEKDDGWGKWSPSKSTAANSWRSMRGNALGPTVAWLRGNNGKFAGKK